MNPKITQLQALKAGGLPITVLTAYDFPMAKLLDESGIDLILVGDSLGMVVLGYPDTTQVTMEDMLHHTRAVARAATKAPVVADLPFASYQNPGQALLNARRLMDAGAHAVKLEGGTTHTAQIAALCEVGIPVMAHIGMMPQSVRIEGGYRIKGKTPVEADSLLADAKAVEAAGAFAVVLELVVPAVTRQITGSLRIPTIGIGSGTECDGQVLVTHDLVGMYPWFTPKFVNQRAQLAESIRSAARAFIADTKKV